MFTATKSWYSSRHQQTLLQLSKDKQEEREWGVQTWCGCFIEKPAVFITALFLCILEIKNRSVLKSESRTAPLHQMLTNK